ncbi:MAG: hypothetical protein VX871_12735 [Pseudomonadota bacterium]|nr:hypothetical protein [Pseudomonadota bacterium]
MTKHLTTMPKDVMPVGETARAPDTHRRKAGKTVIRKYGPVGAFLRPIGISVALLLALFGTVSLGTTFWRSYQRHVEFTAPTHQDGSVFDIFFKSSIPPDAVELVVKDVDGKLRHVVAGKSATNDFVNETILMLDAERDRIKQAAREDVARQFQFAFSDREQAINGYADWFFEWKRSYVVLKETLTSAAARFAETGKYESLPEAVERDIKDYFMRHYEAQVLRPEMRDRTITEGVEAAVRSAHDSYRRVIANSDMRLQLFLARNTRHLETFPADAPLTQTRLDWDAQKWKAPTYLMEDRAFDGIAGIGVAAGSGTLGALVLGPAINRAMSQAFGALSRRFVTAFSARLALAEQGAAAGTLVEPGGGTVVGAVAGVLVGFAADYFVNKANEQFNRDKFIAANEEALNATIDAWRGKLTANVDAAIDRWFDDARSSVVLAGK